MILLVGPSASGKTEVGKCLETNFKFNKVVTYTTRAKRSNEIDDVDYHFISKEQFMMFKQSNFFFETVCYNENFYGTALRDFSDYSYLIIDPKGLSEYKIKDLFNISFFLQTSKDVRKKRMINRGDDIKDINKRLQLDDTYFDINKMDGIDYIICVDDKTIYEITKEIYSIQQNAIMK